MKKKKGKFITMEGPEGSGKSTQAGLLTEYLAERGFDIVRTREPGGVSISEQLREILLDPDSRISARTELLLYAAGRAQHTQELIEPALREGKYVVCERYTHASVAYQGYGRRLDIDIINQLNLMATGGISPDLTILMDLEAAAGLERVKASDRDFDRLEKEDIQFHERVREGYLRMASEDSCIAKIDATLSRDVIRGRIIEELRNRKLI